MKRFLLGTLIGLVLGWATVPIVKANYSVDQSDRAVPGSTIDDDELRKPQAYKWYLTQMLMHMIAMDEKLTTLNDTMKAIKDKLHA